MAAGATFRLGPPTQSAQGAEVAVGSLGWPRPSSTLTPRPAVLLPLPGKCQGAGTQSEHPWQGLPFLGQGAPWGTMELCPEVGKSYCRAVGKGQGPWDMGELAAQGTEP